MIKPSAITEGYWLYAWAPPTMAPPTSRVGKWLIFVPLAELDSAWARVAAAVEAGRLGPAAKARTALKLGHEPSETKVVCVYTRDHQDEADKQRVRKVLRRLGFNERLRYKTDDETRAEAKMTRSEAVNSRGIAPPGACAGGKPLAYRDSSTTSDPLGPACPFTSVPDA